MSVQPAHNLSLEEMDKQSFLHPYTLLKDHSENGPTIVSAAKGVKITDTNGKEYIDSMAGLWCVNIGWGRDEVVEETVEAAMRLGAVVRNVKAGNAGLVVQVNTAGTFVLSGGRVVNATRTVGSATTTRLPVRANAKYRKVLNRKGRVTVQVRVTFRATTGEVLSETKKVVLVKK